MIELGNPSKTFSLLFNYRTFNTISFLILCTLGLCQSVDLGLPNSHSDIINSVKFSHSGTYLVTSSNDRTARSFDVETGKVISIYSGHTSVVESAIWSKNSRRILTASWDHTAILFDAELRQVITRYKGHKGALVSAVFSSDEKMVLTASQDGTACIFETETGKLIRKIPASQSGLISASFSPDNELILIAAQDGIVSVFHWNSGKQIRKYKGTSIDQPPTFSPDGAKIMFIADDYHLFCYDLNRSKAMLSLKLDSKFIRHAEFSRDQKTILLSTYELDINKLSNHRYGGTALLVDIGTSKILHEFSASNEMSQKAIFHPDGKSILSICTDSSIRVYGNTQGYPLLSTLHVKSKIRHIARNALTNRIAVIGFDNSIEIFGLTDYSSISRFKPSMHSVEGLFLTLRDEYFVRLPAGQSIEIYHVNTGKLHCAFDMKEELTSLTIAKSHNLILVGTKNGCVHLIDLQTKTKKLIHCGPTKVNSIITNSGETKALVGTQNGPKILIDLLEMKWDTLSNSSTIRNAIFMPDERYYLQFSNEIISKTQVSNGAISKLYGADSKVILDACISPVGNKVAVAYLYGLIRIYDLHSGDLLKQLNGHTNSVRSIEFNTTGEKILTASDDGSVILFDAKTGYVIKTFRGNGEGMSSATFSPDQDRILAYGKQNHIYLFGVDDDLDSQIFSEHYSKTTGALLSKNENFLLSCSKDGSVIIRNLEDSSLVIKQFILENDPSKWVHVHPSGLFDASKEAMDMIYWTKGLDIIEFSQLKDRYWVPGLWKKVIIDKRVPLAADINNLKLQPQIVLGRMENGQLPIKLIKREGGYGGLSIRINGKEVTSDSSDWGFDTSQPSQTVYFSIDNHPYLTQGENVITVRASSSDGFVQGRGVSLIQMKPEREKVIPSFYGVVVGVSNYENPNINLAYPDKDAQAISFAVKKAADNLFLPLGGNVEVHELSTTGSLIPSKENIRLVFDEISSKAKSEDIIFIYLSGHGITYGDANSSDFHFLTSNATAANREA